jgi:hypothetical protein
MASRQRLRLIRSRDSDRESHKRPRTGNMCGVAAHGLTLVVDAFFRWLFLLCVSGSPVCR